ncbi:MAG TPA: EAL domain-containing protein [Burkholderiaceae bacterium]|nr:EAL domain-containing protein [Burkholderiaceae bacterium]
MTRLQSSLSERTVLASTVQQHEDYTERVAADIDKQLRLARASLSELAGNIDGANLRDAKSLHYFLTSRIGIQQSFESIVVYGIDGRAIASRPSIDMPAVAGEPWFQAALSRNGTPTLRKPFFSPLSGEPSVAIAYPAHDEKGVLRAIVVGSMAINQDQLALSPPRSGKAGGGHFILLTRERDLVMHPEPSYITLPLAAAGDSAAVVLQGLAHPEQSLIGPNHRGVRSLYVFRPVQSADWMLVGVMANEQAHASLSLLSRQMLLAGAVLAALLIPAMWLLVSRMLKPLDQLRSEMRKLRDGTADTPVQLDTRATEELRQLVDEFAGMAAAWRTAESALQREKERAEVTLESIADGVIATTRDGRVAAMNRAAETLTGWSSEEALGQPFAAVFALCAEKSGAALADPVLGAMEKGEVVSTSGAALRSRQGGLTPIDHSAAPIHTGEGRIDGAVLVFRNVAAERRAAQELEWRATHDAMTGLVNRAGYEHALQGLFQPAAAGADGPHSLVMLDLDEFKIVNDSCGHAAGDELLRQLAALLVQQSRRSDTVARLGGDEFAVLMYHCAGEQALRLAEGLRTTIAQFRFQWSGRVFHVGASFGVVEINPSFANAADVQKAADMACYMAKRTGRNRICVHSSEKEQLEAMRSEMFALGTLRSAIEGNRLRLFAQGILPLNGPVGGGQYFEVLVRMVDEAGKLVLPGAFLPAAERYGLMDQLDRWVVTHAAQLCSARFGPDCWDELDTMSINLSPRTLRDPDIGAFLIEQLQHHGVPFGKVCFEVTETAAIENPVQVAALMRGLRQQGVRFALDDFGVGMTSLAQLRDLPIDVLKIDGSFVHHIHEHGVNATLVEAVQVIARRLSMKTVAERVETEAERSHLKALGVDYVQGYLLAKPGPMEQVIGSRVPVIPQAAEAA